MRATLSLFTFHLSFIYRLALVLISAVSFALTSPNELALNGFGPLGFISLVPLAIALYHTKGFGQFSLLLFCFNAVRTAISSYWLLFFFEFGLLTYSSTTIGVGIAGMIGLSFLYFIKDKPAIFRALWFALLWTLYEYMQSRGYWAYPWGLIAYSLHTMPLFNQIVDSTGPWGLSFIFALINACLAELIITFTKTGNLKRSFNKLKALLLVTCSLFLITLTYGTIRYFSYFSHDKQVNLLLSQQDLDTWFTGDIQNVTAHINVSLEALAANPGFYPDLIVSGETIISGNYFENFSRYFPTNFTLQDFIAYTNTYHLIGSRWQGTLGDHNGTLLVNNRGEVLARYAKRHLVPMAEGFPLTNFDWAFLFFENVLGISPAWQPGNMDTLFVLPTRHGDTIYFTTPICYEDAFSYITRHQARLGADLFITPTNDAWSRREVAMQQHLVASLFRPIETRRTLARAANAGITAIIDERGRITQQIEPFTDMALLAELNLHTTTTTFYVKFGDWLIAVFIIILLLQLKKLYWPGKLFKKND
ncbi:MAG: apolipoprotein N-acyltransferase [Spirochaetaceae bacterium]|nr:apolipoprotein N-acyltransferase [Spirochaetaceae bacterium]